jgi:methanethiol oxidase
MDANTFELKGPWEKDRGTQQLPYDLWWHLGHDTMIHLGLGHSEHGEGQSEPGVAVGRQIRPQNHVWDLDKGRHLLEIDLVQSNNGCLSCVPLTIPKTYGFVSVGVSLKDLSSPIWMWYREEGKNAKWAIRKVIEIPAEPADPERCHHC